MAGDPFQPLTPGQPLDVYAASWNAMLRAGRAFSRGEEDGPGGGLLDFGDLNPALRVLVRNDTGGALSTRSVLALGTPFFDPAARPEDCARQPLFPGTAPGASGPFAVTEAPAATSQVVTAVVMGVVVVDVNVTSAGHAYATLDSGNTSRLTSAASGPAYIVYKPGGTGVKTCVVCLNNPPVAAGGLTADAAFLLGDFALNQTTGTYQTVLSTPSLPAAGTYLFWCDAVGELNTNTPGDRIDAQLAFSTGGAVDFPVVTVGAAGVSSRATGHIVTNAVLATGSLVASLKACRTFGGTVATSTVRGLSVTPTQNFNTAIAWLKIA